MSRFYKNYAKSSVPEEGILLDRTHAVREADAKQLGYDDSNIYVRCKTEDGEVYVPVSKLKVHLYHLTHQFVQYHIGHYYKQYKGSVYDLAQDYLMEFLTPKCRKTSILRNPDGSIQYTPEGLPVRVLNTPETLIDRYDSKITSFEYMVKHSVIHKLIDSSRCNPFHFSSFDVLHEAFGDMITEAFHLSVDPNVHKPSDSFTSDDLDYYRSRLSRLPENVIKSISDEYRSIRSTLPDNFISLFDGLFTLSPSYVKTFKSILNVTFTDHLC